ncbi:MarR family winged helix-turn-helix transcriptional regulator [Cellulomonas composti]|uniref:HTH marR-type domain-containing protein n=1 Tax=Cellulomonas composti TaxID=266130 RepID=A0A511JCP4_9CELL|nr:MarR family transcriptional regulator [Cellulomonas composti]GEL95768.1 hypothetical protein CCO02nite_24260 [Cellulomonas composti]
MTDTPAAELLHAVEGFQRRLRESAGFVARDTECTRSAATVVRLLNREPRHVGDIASALRVDTSVASRQVSLLVDAGLVERTVDADDRRVRTLRLTDSGRARAAAVERALIRHTDRVVADWTPDEVRDTVRAIDRLSTALDALDAPPPA